MLDPRFTIVVFILNNIAFVSYCVQTLRGQTKPNRVTWFLYALFSAVIFAVQVSKQVDWAAAAFSLSLAVGPMLILLASFISSQAQWHLTRFDLVCGLFSLVGLVLWLVTKQGDLAVALTIIANVFAGLPTLRKAWRAPETENGLAFVVGVVAGILTLLTIDQWTFVNVAFTMWVTTCNVLMTYFIFAKPGLRRRSPAVQIPAA